MAKVEIEETEFLANKKLRETVSKMLANKESRELVQRAQKVIDPSAVIPEIDSKAAQEAATAAAQKVVADFEARQKAAADEATKNANMAALTSRWNAGRAALKSQRYTDEGIAAIEKLMEERGIGDHADAQIIFEKLHPPADVANPNPGAWNFFEPGADKDSADDMKALMDSKGENEGILRKMINQTLTEVRGR